MQDETQELRKILEQEGARTKRSGVIEVSHNNFVLKFFFSNFFLGFKAVVSFILPFIGLTLLMYIVLGSSDVEVEIRIISFVTNLEKGYDGSWSWFYPYVLPILYFSFLSFSKLRSGKFFARNLVFGKSKVGEKYLFASSAFAAFGEKKTRIASFVLINGFIGVLFLRIVVVLFREDGGGSTRVAEEGGAQGIVGVESSLNTFLGGQYPLIFAVAFLVLFSRDFLTRYRIKHGWFGTNSAEAIELVDWVHRRYGGKEDNSPPAGGLEPAEEEPKSSSEVSGQGWRPVV